jgi:phosphoglycerol transferase MdoB-like AlkP superfamily enzyme
LPEALKDHGYRTFAIHGNPWLEERFGFNQGFDEFLFTHWYKDTFDAQKVNDQALQWLDKHPTLRIGARDPTSSRPDRARPRRR